MSSTGILNQATSSLMLIVNSRFVTSASPGAIHLVAVHPEPLETKVLWQSTLLLGGIERPRSCWASRITWVPFSHDLSSVHKLTLDLSVHCHRCMVSWMYPGRTAGWKTYLQRQRVSQTIATPWSTMFIQQNSYVDQLNQILHYLGTPSEDTLRRVGSPRVSRPYVPLKKCLIYFAGTRLYSISPNQASRSLLHLVPSGEPSCYWSPFSNAMLRSR